MQRKNNLLKRDGFAMIIAIIIIISTALSLSLFMTTQTSKQTTSLYLYEQSMLLAKSATEYARLEIAQNPPCTNLDKTFIQDNIYNIQIKIKYIYTSDIACPDSMLFATVQTQAQSGSAIIDVSVSVTTNEAVRYFRRTIKK